MNTIFTTINAIRPSDLRPAAFGMSAIGRAMWADFCAALCVHATTVAVRVRKSVLSQGEVAFGHAQGHQTWRPLTG